MYKEKIVDAITGEETWRNYTSEENIKAEEADFNSTLVAAAQASKNAARQVVLDKLGLSVDELSALLG